LSNKSKFEQRRRKERKGIKENDKKNPFISLLCALRPFAVKLFRQPHNMKTRTELKNGNKK